MDDDVLLRIYKLQKVEDCFGIPVTAWLVNPLMLNGIGFGMVSGKDGGVNSLAPSAAEIMYTVALGLGPLVM